jgi:hypothetical protein
MQERRSKVGILAKNLRRIALVLLLMFVVSAVSAVVWVDDEFVDPPLWRYLTAIADVATFLIAAVVAWVGSAMVQAIGRVRDSILTAMYERSDDEHEESERELLHP